MRNGRSGGVADVGRQGNANGLEQGADAAGDGRAQHLRLAVLGKLDLLQPVEVAQGICPLRLDARRLAARLQLLAQDEGKEEAEDMAPDPRFNPFASRHSYPTNTKRTKRTCWLPRGERYKTHAPFGK